jgi:hypothetical protein
MGPGREPTKEHIMARKNEGDNTRHVGITLSAGCDEFFKKAAAKEGISKSAFLGRLLTGMAVKHGKFVDRDPVAYRRVGSGD